MEEQINLTKTKAWIVTASVDERSSATVGYYKDYNIAAVDAKGAGWYGSDGKVDQEDVYEDEDDNIYVLKYKGKYTDVDRKYKEETLNVIKSKLSTAELEFLGI